MRVGTKSILFGAHAFWLHPWFVAAAWWKLYGFPWDPRLWVAFAVHDLGYWGSPNMDGPEGEQHPVRGANIVAGFCDGILVEYGLVRTLYEWLFSYSCALVFGRKPFGYWSDLVLYHSRFLARKEGTEPSLLCAADKLAIVLTPFWIYYPMTRLSGELAEYMERSRGRGKYATMHLDSTDARAWYDQVQEYLRAWVEANRDGSPDTMTPAREEMTT